MKRARGAALGVVRLIGALGLALLGTTAVAMPVINAADVVVGEGEGYAEFVVRLSAPSLDTVSVTYYTSSGTASSADYSIVGSTTLGFAPGETVKTVRIAVKDDTLVEGAESFSLRFSGATNGTIGTGEVVATIIDNDGVAGTPVISVSDPVVDESAGEAVFVLSLDRLSVQAVNVSYATVAGTADAADYTGVSGTASFAPGQTVVRVRVPITDDGFAEGEERFDLLLSNPVNGNLPDTRGTATIGSNDQSTVIKPVINAADVVVGEGEGYAEFVVRLSAPSLDTVSVTYYTSSGTASSADYSIVGSTTLGFAPGETVKTVRIAVKDDTLVEGAESFSLRFSGATNGTIGTGEVVATIIDNDGVAGTPVISVSDPVVDESAGEAVFVLSLDRLSVQAVNVSYATVAGTADAADYTGVSGTASFAPGQTVVRVRVPITDDGFAEGEERFDLLLSNPVNGNLPDTRGTATIGSNDQSTVIKPVINAADVVVGEGEGYAEFVVRLSAPSLDTVSVTYYTSSGTASSADYSIVGSTTLGFAPGETVKTVRIAVKDDTLVEGAESFSLRFSGATNGTIGTGEVVATIIDNDGASSVPPLLAVSPPASADFGSVGLKNKLSKTLVVSNSGGEKLTGTIAVGSPFSVTPTTFSLTAGANVTVSVSFEPTVLGPATGTVAIISNGGRSDIQFTGVGVSPAKVVLKPASQISFSETQLGEQQRQTITITNTGLSTLVGSCSTSLPFSLPNGCNINLAPSLAQVLPVVFTPTVLGEATANVLFTTNASTSPKYIIKGVGVQPVLAVAPSSALALGKIVVGSSGESFVVFANTGNGTLITSCDTAGPISLPTGCPSALRHGFEAVVPVRVTPIVVGAVNSIISIHSNGGDQMVSVNAEGVAASLAKIESLTPRFGLPGTKVLIHGTGFGANKGNSRVQFGTYDAQVVGWSATDIVVMAPDRNVASVPVTVVRTTGTSDSPTFQYPQYWWPLHAIPDIAQDFAEWGDVSAIRYHTGLDIPADNGTPVYPTAAGEIVFLQKVSEIYDHGFGNTVIIKHSVPGTTKPVYSQYSHLSAIDPEVEAEVVKLCGAMSTKTASVKCAAKVPGLFVSPNMVIGRTGKSGFGQLQYPMYGWHLHFELKNVSTLGVNSFTNKADCSTAASATPYYGYTCESPTSKGYYDPAEFVFPVSNSKWQFTGVPFPMPVVVSEQVDGRFLPADNMRVIGKVRSGTYLSYRGMPAPWGTCASGMWREIQQVASPRCSADNTDQCFEDLTDPINPTGAAVVGRVPDVWICGP